jgi:predicted PurR-regulated permease PerM
LLRLFPRHGRRAAATLTVFLLLGVLLVQLGIMIVNPLLHEIQSFSENWRTHQEQALKWMEWVQQRWEALPPDVRVWLEDKWREAQGSSDLGATLTEQMRHIAHRTAESGIVLVELILIPVLAFSFLTEWRPLKRELAVVLPAARVKDGLYLLRQTGSILQSYAIGQLILALIAGGVVYALMLLLGVRYALVLAVIAAVTRVIPVIGPIIGAIPIVLMSSLQGWERGLAVLIAFCVMHLLESKIVMPRLIGYRMKLHPAVVIIVLLIGAEFFGMWGMFLAAPAAAVVKVLFHHFLVRPSRMEARLEASLARASREFLASEGTGADEEPGVPDRESAREREREHERPAVAGVRHHSRAH